MELKYAKPVKPKLANKHTYECDNYACVKVKTDGDGKAVHVTIDGYYLDIPALREVAKLFNNIADHFEGGGK